MMDPYATLDVPREASADDVRKAYRRAALRLHPDKAGEASAEAFREATEAHDLLSDPGKRERYDLFGELPTGGVGGGAAAAAAAQDLDGVLRNMFCSMNAVRAGENVEVRLSAAEVYAGCSKTVEYASADKCVACDGSGAANPEDVVCCIACGGRGTAPHGIAMMFMGVTASVPCPSCAGVGRSFRTHRRCGACAGRGAVDKRRRFDVRVPRGTTATTRHVLGGRGGYDAVARAHRDLILTLIPTMPEGVTVAGNGDVTVRVRVDLADVMCGYSRRLELFDGACVLDIGADAYRSPAVGQAFPGRGMCDGSTLRVEFDVDFPKSEPEAERLAKLRDVFCRMFRMH